MAVIDAHSKWIDAHITSGSTSAITISKRRQSCSPRDIPDVIVSDNCTSSSRRRHIDQLHERLPSFQVVSPGLPVPLEMTLPNEGAESPDEPQASQPVQLSSPVKTAPSQPTHILPASAPVAELRPSIISKKAAESLSALVLDVKFGRGALYKQPEEARELAKSLARLSEGMGIRTTALLTNMDNVIGRTVGNALEVAEALECLRGVGPNTLKELVTELGSHLLVNAQQAADVDEGRKRIADSLDNGEAMKKFATMLTAQGVAPDTVVKLTTSQEEAIAVLPRANFSRHLNCAKTGYVTAIDASVCALVSARLGAGRMKASDVVDPAVGLQLYVDVGSHVRQGDRWLTVHYNNEPLPDDYVTRLQGALSIDNKEPQHTIVQRIPVSVEVKQLPKITECSVALRIPELIQKKRDGERLSAETIRLFVSGAVSGDMQDCQIAIFFRRLPLDGDTAVILRRRHSCMYPRGCALGGPSRDHHLATVAKCVDRESDWRTRGIKEVIWIRKTTDSMNRDEGRYRLSHIYDDLQKGHPGRGRGGTYKGNSRRSRNVTSRRPRVCQELVKMMLQKLKYLLLASCLIKKV
ncbi:Thymidine phosphorylase [Lamellibrachia satsuma]|nr:Thymidine phosphorylase [Lamellibrachia satsuma]